MSEPRLLRVEFTAKGGIDDQPVGTMRFVFADDEALVPTDANSWVTRAEAVAVANAADVPLVEG